MVQSPAVECNHCYIVQSSTIELSEMEASKMKASEIESSATQLTTDQSSTVITSLCPPPIGVFSTREDLLKHTSDFAFTQGYAITIKKSKKDKQV